MSIKVHLPPFFQQLAGGVKVIDTDGNTVGECLKSVGEQYPQLKARLFNEQGKLMKGISIFINRENTLPSELNKPVKDGDTVHIASLIFGG